MTGILTYHFAHNYGAMLQAYATKTYLEQTGEKAELINYCPEKISSQYAIGFSHCKPRQFPRKVLDYCRRKKQFQLFESFKTNELECGESISREQLPEFSKRYSKIIAGSDQVWNSDINFNDDTYFLDFAGQDVIKTGYSVSIGSTKISPYLRKNMDIAAERFDRISFREKSAADCMEFQYHKKFAVTVDPVFLLPRDAWVSLEKKPEKFSWNNFILFYSLKADTGLEKLVQDMSKKTNIPILSIHPLCKQARIADYNLKNVGPREFLWLIHHAEYVASNSFHATAFSIIFKKKALLKPHPVLGARNKDLLETVHAQDCNQEGIYNFEAANFDDLNALILYSQKYLNGEDYELPEVKPFYPVLLGLKRKDQNLRLESQSGGAFSVIAEYFLNQGAVVYGCGVNEQLNVVYQRITEIDQLKRVKGSKYVRAALGGTFSSVCQDLKKGKKVLFAGHACIVDGLLQCVSKLPQKDNLYTVDFICHGTPSHAVYKEFLNMEQQKHRKKVTGYLFRFKDSQNMDIGKTSGKLLFSDGSSQITRTYSDLFYSNLVLRPCCGECRYASHNRISDFTVADYWGVEKYDSDFYDSAGVSLLFLNRQRSLEILEILQENCDLVESDLQKCQQPNMIIPSPIPSVRSRYWETLKERGLEKSLQSFTAYGGILFKIKRKIMRKMGLWQ